MSGPVSPEVQHDSIAQWVEQNQDVADEIFESVNLALHQILPGSEYHSRYANAQELGLAIVIARDDNLDFNPLYERHGELDRDAFDNLAYRKDNRIEGDEGSEKAWAWKEGDEKTFGGKITDTARKMGRFATMAVSKVFHLSHDDEKLSSHEADGPEVAEGEVGFAGARRLGGNTLIATSGLWDVHDHIVSAVFSYALQHSMKYGGETDDTSRNIAISEMLQEQFDNVQDIILQMGRTAESFSGEEVSWLIHEIDHHYLENLESTAA